MEKVYGATERHDQLIVFGKGASAVLIYGYGTDGEQGFDYRHQFTHKPTKHEVLQVIVEHVNKLVDEKILTGFKWADDNGVECSVWLSEENQRNFSEAHRLSVLLGAKKYETIQFKIGEDEDNRPKYRTFETLNDLNTFYLSAFAFIKQTLSEGWAEKDAAIEWVETLSL